MTRSPEVPEPVVADKYDRMMQLAAVFDAAGEQMRQRALLGAEVLTDDDVTESEDLSPATWREAEHDIRLATTGRGGLLERSLELDADALVVRATVLTYRWIDELQVVAQRTLGSIAGRAVGYLAPEIALGGAIVSAGLIETDALDRDGLAAYLNELASANPELMEHFSSGGGGLLDRLQMRALLTVGLLGSPSRTSAAAAGLRAIGAGDFVGDGISAVRDAAGALSDETVTVTVSGPEDGTAPSGLEQLMGVLTSSHRLRVQKVGPGRYIAYLPGTPVRRGELRLVGADRTGEVAAAVRAIGSAVENGAHVMLVGSAGGGVTAAEIAARVADDAPFVVDQVVTVASPSSQATRLPASARILSLADRSDPVALLGFLMNAAVPNRLTVVYDAGQQAGPASYVAGGRAADEASDADLRAELDRLQTMGYLAG